MSTLEDRLALKRRLPRTWPAFFERYGTFTETQLQVIPAILDGQNVMLCAPTASGKTAAALAPLIERHCPPGPSLRARPARSDQQEARAHAEHPRQPPLARHGPALLYIAPTRALVNDLAARLEPSLEMLNLLIDVKTGDRALRRGPRADLLLTTPESIDALLTSQPRLFAMLQALVLDEIHLLDGTPRGDHLRVLLNRIRRIRGYAYQRGDAHNLDIQYAALSATIGQPEQIASRYFSGAVIQRMAGGRALEAEQIALTPVYAHELQAYLGSFIRRGWRKALAFCNSRAEVESYAAATRQSSPFGDAVYVHYSNIDPRRRRETEQAFAAAEAAICFASTTLELGIDIGSIDSVLLLGPPGSLASFTQRAGRGNRRRSLARVACFYRTPLERLLFAALCNPAAHPLENLTPLRPAVAIQQIFSMVKQSLSGGVRLAELAELFAPMLSSHDIEAILGELEGQGYLNPGRPGEWRAGPTLNTLLDQQQTAHPSLSIYSNIQMGESRLVEIRDQHTQETLAKVDAQWFDRPEITLEGRALNIIWADGEALWVRSHRSTEQSARLLYRSAHQQLSYELARLLPSELGLEAGQAPLVPANDGWLWFHWLGDLYGRAALDLLRYRLVAQATSQPGLCVLLAEQLNKFPEWTEAQVARYLQDNYRRLEPQLDLGPFQRLLPLQLRQRAVVEQFNIPRFLAAIAALRPIRAPENLREDLERLLDDED